MNGRGKWIVLGVGVIVISATCGFGYQAKATLTQYEEAKAAFLIRDWDRVVDNLSDTSNLAVPPKKSLGAFIKRYIDPAIDEKRFKVASRQWNSSMVPIPDEEMTYQRALASGRKSQLIRLSYSDKIAWFDVPLAKKRYGVFQGKKIAISFYPLFFRAAVLKHPVTKGKGAISCYLAFVKEEKEMLSRMGILPIHVRSSAKTWEEYEKELKNLIAKSGSSR
jgi:hypothetical protein